MRQGTRGAVVKKWKNSTYLLEFWLSGSHDVGFWVLKATRAGGSKVVEIRSLDAARFEDEVELQGAVADLRHR